MIKGPLARFWGGEDSISQNLCQCNGRIVVFHGFISAISGERIEDVLPPKNLWNSGVMVIKTAFFFQLLAFLVKKVNNEQVVTICRKGRSFLGTFGDVKEKLLRLATRFLMHFWNTIFPPSLVRSHNHYLTFCHDQPLNLFGQS